VTCLRWSRSKRLRLEDEIGAGNLGQIEHKCLLADGVLGDELKRDIVAWWAERVPGLDQG